MLLSMIFHLLLFSIWAGMVRFNIWDTHTPLDDLAEKAPIVFELQADEKFPEVVETPEDARLKDFQKETELASDKNAAARNSEADPNLDLGEAFLKGEFEFRELPQNQTPLGGPVPAAQNEVPNEAGKKEEFQDENATEIFATNGGDKFSKEYLTDKNYPQQAGQRLPKGQYDNQESRAEEMGGFSFNTYDWDFAPYMLVLKKKVEGNIFPPPAFMRLGIISGTTFLKFKIYPNGELKDLELLKYEGHESLMQTSMRAIEISAPFAQLPSNFPEAYLEVTAKFHYSISRQP